VHQLVGDTDLPAQVELGADAPIAIDAARVGVDLVESALATTLAVAALATASVVAS